MSFSFWKLIQCSLDFGKERHGHAAQGWSTPRMRRRVLLDETDTLVLELQASPDEETFTGTPHWPSVSDFLQSHPRLCVVYERLFPAISIQGYSVETVFLVNAFFRALSGLSQGMTGAGGPPIIVAYALFDPTKGAIRGLSGLGFITCGNEMCEHAGTSRSCSCVTVACSYDIYCSHGSRLLLSRCGVPRLICAPSLTPCPAFIHHSEIHLYAGLCVAALLGSSFGTWLRKFVPLEVLAGQPLLLSAVALTAAACRLSWTARFGSFGETAPCFCRCSSIAVSSICLRCLSFTFCCRPFWLPAPSCAISTPCG